MLAKLDLHFLSDNAAVQDVEDEEDSGACSQPRRVTAVTQSSSDLRFPPYISRSDASSFCISLYLYLLSLSSPSLW